LPCRALRRRAAERGARVVRAASSQAPDPTPERREAVRLLRRMYYSDQGALAGTTQPLAWAQAQTRRVC
jgi:hypothetical protein